MFIYSNQLSLAHTGFERVTKRTRKRISIEEMNLVIPWSELLSLLAPHAPPGTICSCDTTLWLALQTHHNTYLARRAWMRGSTPLPAAGSGQ